MSISQLSYSLYRIILAEERWVVLNTYIDFFVIYIIDGLIGNIGHDTFGHWKNILELHVALATEPRTPGSTPGTARCSRIYQTNDITNSNYESNYSDMNKLYLCFFLITTNRPY